MKTCNDQPRIAAQRFVDRHPQLDVHQLASETLAARVSTDHFVRTSVRVEDLQLRIEGPGLTPMSPSRAHHCGRGFARGVGGGDVQTTQRACLDDVAKLAAALTQLKADYKAWRNENPDAVEPGNGARTLGEILDDPALSTGDLCVNLVDVILHERPETADELRATIPAHEVPTSAAAPSAAPGGDGSNTELSRGLFSAFGMGANLLAGLLQSPLAIPLLTAAATVIPGAQVLVPFIPVIAPIAGMALSGLGGMATQVGQGQAPGLDASGAMSPDMLSQLLPAITGMIGGAAGAPAAAPVVPLPAT